MRRVLVLTLAVIALASCAKAPQDTKLRGPHEKLVHLVNAVQEKLRTTDEAMTGAAARLAKIDFTSTEAREILADLCRHEEKAIDCAIIDIDGTIVSVEPSQYRVIEGTNIAGQPHVQRLRQTQQPVLSSVFRSIEKKPAVDFAWPIFGRSGKLAGSVSMIVNPLTYFSQIIRPQLGWDARDVWLIETNGEIFYSRHPESIGEHPLKNQRYRNMPGLIPLIERILATPAGEGSFYHSGIGKSDPQPRHLLWRTVALHGTTLRLVVLSPTP